MLVFTVAFVNIRHLGVTFTHASKLPFSLSRLVRRNGYPLLLCEILEIALSYNRNVDCNQFKVISQFKARINNRHLKVLCEILGLLCAIKSECSILIMQRTWIAVRSGDSRLTLIFQIRISYFQYQLLTRSPLQRLKEKTLNLDHSSAKSRANENALAKICP